MVRISWREANGVEQIHPVHPKSAECNVNDQNKQNIYSASHTSSATTSHSDLDTRNDRMLSYQGHRDTNRARMKWGKCCMWNRIKSFPQGIDTIQSAMRTNRDRRALHCHASKKKRTRNWEWPGVVLYLWKRYKPENVAPPKEGLHTQVPLTQPVA